MFESNDNDTELPQSVVGKAPTFAESAVCTDGAVPKMAMASATLVGS